MTDISAGQAVVWVYGLMWIVAVWWFLLFRTMRPFGLLIAIGIPVLGAAFLLAWDHVTFSL